MKFFDPKQDVLDIQLTQYGKHLLSSGKFRPVYYAFFDDDILYYTLKPNIFYFNVDYDKAESFKIKYLPELGSNNFPENILWRHFRERFCQRLISVQRDVFFNSLRAHRTGIFTN